MRSPNIWPGFTRSPGAIARTGSESFIAIVKLDIPMPTHIVPARLACRLLAVAASLLWGLSARSQSVPALELDPVVVVATRTPADLQTLGSAVDATTAADLSRQQLFSVADALGAVPGSPVAANGGPGSDVSVFLRGANSDQVLFLVDGLRLNDSNTDYAVYLGGARLGATDSVEVVRGPQSTLYGSEAVGGVVSIQAQKGSGEPSSEATVEAGSFGTVAGLLSAQGARGPWAWSFSASGLHTDNERANNAFDSGNVILRLDRALSDSVALGTTLRGYSGRYGDPGDIYTNDPYAHETEENWLATVFADLKFTPEWTAHVTVGGQDRRYVSFDESPGVFTSTTTVQNRRGVLDAQATYAGFAAQKLTAGFTAEDETTFDNGYGDIDRRQTLFGAFAEDEWHPLAPLYLTGGLRYDDFDTFGHALTGRVTAAWLSADRQFKVRASYGTGFNAPSFLELYGVSSGYQGNPDLSPERSRGYDAGADWFLPAKLGVLSATWFHNDFSNLIDYNFNVYPGTTVNVGRAVTEGLELSTKLAIGASTQLRVAYTYLESDDVTNATRLLRRPRNSGSADLWRDLGRGWSAGVGLHVVAGVADVDALTYLDVNDPDYMVARIYGEWRASPRLALRARVENLLDKKYQPVNGYPANGAGAFGEVDWKL